MRAAAMQVESQASIGARPGTRRARVSLARSLVPITKPDRRNSESFASAAIDRILKMASGVSIIAQMRDFVIAMHVEQAAAEHFEHVRIGYFRHQDSVGRGVGGGGEVVGMPGRVDAVDADEHLARAEAAGFDGVGDLRARRLLGVGRHQIFEIEDDAIGGQGFGFFQRAGIGARHVKHAAARTMVMPPTVSAVRKLSSRCGCQDVPAPPIWRARSAA